MHVFVYGTLKKGYGNNRVLEDAKFVGEAFTVDKYAMIDAGFPVAMETSDEDKFPILGEVYDIKKSKAILERLDRLEGEGFMYDRKEVVVYLMGKKKRIAASIYIGREGFWGNHEHSNDKYYKQGKLSWPGDGQ